VAQRLLTVRTDPFFLGALNPTSTNARRRVLKATVSVAPALMTIASRPVLGGTCMNASLMAGSLNGSVLAATSTCSGCSPSYWASTNRWPLPYHANGSSTTDFHSTTTGFKKGPVADFGSHSLMYVLGHISASAAYEVGAYVTAAILNARIGYTPVLTEDAVTRIWNEYSATGTYQPTIGVSWNGSQIVAYIKTTMA
jgi:hypothetical protein